MIEIISTEQQKITDQEVTEALRTLRQYCKEHEDTGPECRGCCAHVVCGNLAPMDWDLPGDEECGSMSHIKDRLKQYKDKYSDCYKYAGVHVKVIQDMIEQLQNDLEQDEKENGWIPVSEKLPESNDYILVSFENYTLPSIGRYEADEDGGGDFYPGDEDRSYASFGVFVNAWRPLPEPYKEEDKT